jgi:hypothetical protein
MFQELNFMKLSLPLTKILFIQWLYKSPPQKGSYLKNSLLALNLIDYILPPISLEAPSTITLPPPNFRLPLRTTTQHDAIHNSLKPNRRVRLLGTFIIVHSRSYSTLHSIWWVMTRCMSTGNLCFHEWSLMYLRDKLILHKCLRRIVKKKRRRRK